MSYKVTDTIIIDQSRNLNSIGIATFSGPVIVGVGTSTILSVTGNVNVSGIVTGSVVVASKDPGTGIATDSTESIFGNGWRLSSPASTTYYRLATLPAGGGGNTFDHLIINGTLGSWLSNQQTPFEIYFSNRNTFTSRYISYGSVRSDVRILGISTNNAIEVWAQHQASQFTKLVYNITNSLQVIPVLNPVSTTTAPVGTTVFDSSTATPRFIINDSDFVGIGTATPQGSLQIGVGATFTSGGNATFSGIVTASSFAGSGSQLTGINIAISTNTTNSNQLIPYVTSFGSTTGLGATSLLVYNPSSGSLGIGTTVLTGTASQRLQVTGGAYVSGNVGVAVTSPSFAVDVSGDARIRGTNAMRFGGTAGTTNFYIQYNSTTNSLDFVAG